MTVPVIANVARSPEEAERQGRGEAVGAAAEEDEALDIGPLFGEEEGDSRR